MFNTPPSSSSKTLQFNTLLSFLMLNCGVFGDELRSFWCWTEGFWVLKRWVLELNWCVELRGTRNFEMSFEITVINNWQKLLWKISAFFDTSKFQSNLTLSRQNFELFLQSIYSMYFILPETSRDSLFGARLGERALVPRSREKISEKVGEKICCVWSDRNRSLF